MKRRALLAGLGTSWLTGCAQSLAPPAGGEEMTADEDTPSDQRQIALGEIDDAPADAGVTIDIEQRTAMVTPDQIPRFEVTTTNLDRSKRISIKSGHECCLFNRWRAASFPPGLWFFHVAVGVGRGRGERWSADPGGFADYGCGTRLYDPGETITNEYRTWDDGGEDGYMVPGEYRFEAEVIVEEPDDGTIIDEFTWGFTVHVERP